MVRSIDLSIVIPTYNGSLTLPGFIDEIHASFAGCAIEIVLVNDGSTDDTESVCREIVRENPTTRFLQLEKNFGEHSAVLAGLSHATGACVGVLDDDGQNPPAELMRMWKWLEAEGHDVVYGRYLQKRHSWWRNAGSRLNGEIATLLLGKPRDLYFSSFKVMRRSLVEGLLEYRGSRPYLDALIWRLTDRIGQLDVVHRPRELGKSGYNLRKLIGLSLNMALGCSKGCGLRDTGRRPPYVIAYQHGPGISVD